VPGREKERVYLLGRILAAEPHHGIHVCTLARVDTARGATRAESHIYAELARYKGYDY